MRLQDRTSAFVANLELEALGHFGEVKLGQNESRALNWISRPGVIAIVIVPN